MCVVDVPRKNLQIVILNKMLVDVIEPHIYKDLKKYHLLDAKITDKSVKRLIYHHFIHDVSEMYLTKNAKMVYIFNPSSVHKGVVSDHFSSEVFLAKVHALVKKLMFLLPIKFCVVAVDVDKIPTNESSLLEATIDGCYQKTKTMYEKSFTFERLKLFAKRHDLSFLDNDYLHRFKTRQLLI